MHPQLERASNKACISHAGEWDSQKEAYACKAGVLLTRQYYLQAHANLHRCARMAVLEPCGTGRSSRCCQRGVTDGRKRGRAGRCAGKSPLPCCHIRIRCAKAHAATHTASDAALCHKSQSTQIVPPRSAGCCCACSLASDGMALYAGPGHVSPAMTLRYGALGTEQRPRGADSAMSIHAASAAEAARS